MKIILLILITVGNVMGKEPHRGWLAATKENQFWCDFDKGITSNCRINSTTVLGIAYPDYWKDEAIRREKSDIETYYVEFEGRQILQFIKKTKGTGDSD